MNFDTAFEKLIGHEGGYVANPEDPGGETNFGISRRAYPFEDIPGMTLDRAKFLYMRDYWGPVGCDVVPDAIRFDLFDAAVNNGVTTAKRLLQTASGVVPDGDIGPITLQALGTIPGPRLVAWFNARRLIYTAHLPTWRAFSKGWALRIADNLLGA